MATTAEAKATSADSAEGAGADAPYAVIWLHGLGDSGEGWSFLQQQFGSQLPRVKKWIFPDAPVRPISCNGGFPMRGWFDISKIPVSAEDEDEDDEGEMDATIASVHGMIDQQVEAGVPSNRIVLGGFSQGGITALMAGLSYSSPLAGVVCFSGWLRRAAEFDTLANDANKETPVLMGHGEADEVVLFSAGQAAHDRLQTLGYNVQFESYPGMGHSSCPQELSALFTFFSRVMPE